MNQAAIHVIHSFPVWLPQTQTWMYYQVKHLPNDINVHIVCEQTENLDQFGVPNIHCLYDISHLRYFLEKGLRKLRVRTSHSHLASITKKTATEIVHSHFGDIGWANEKVVRESKARHVVTFYGYDVNMLPTVERAWRSRYRDLFQGADVFLCEGPYMKGQLVEMGCPTQKIQVHHLGVDTDQIAFRPRQWERGTPLRVLIAASFQEKKGIPFALQALASFKREIPLEITIIGDGTSEARSVREKQRILEVIQQEGLESKTRLLGYQSYSTLFDEAYQHHIFISPSITASDGDTEGGAPVTLIDMISTGMPVVSTTHCDIPEVVQYGIKDWLVRERDVDSLRERIYWLIENNNTWDQLLLAGRTRMEREYCAEVQGLRLAEIYSNILEKK